MARMDKSRNARTRERMPGTSARRSQDTALLVRVAPAVLIAACCLCYSNSFQVPFLFDDIGSIPENPRIRSLADLAAVFSPAPEQTVSGRPLLQFSFAANYAISGLRTWSYHLVNILIHAGAALALYGILRHTFGSPRLSARFGAAAPGLALAAALLWAVHPLHGESVTYIVQRAESLVGLFYFVTLYCAIRAFELQDAEPPSPPSAARWFVLAFISCAAGMATKEVMATAPVIVLLYDRTFWSDSWSSLARRRAKFYAALVCTWIVVAAAAAGARTASAGFGFENLTPASYALTQFGVVTHYIRLSFVPYPLVFDYFWPVAGSVSQAAAPGLLLLALAALTLFAISKNHPAGYAGAWFFIILAPTSSVVPIITEIAAEHRMYLPLAGLVALLVPAGYLLLQRLMGPRAETVGMALVAMLSIVLGAATFVRNRDYRSSVTIWQDTVAKRPANPRARFNLGKSFHEAGRPDDARREYAKAIEMRAGYADAHNNLGSLLLEMDRPAEALPHFETYTRLVPGSPNGHMNMGIALAQLNRRDEAMKHYEEAARIAPTNAQIQYSMGNLHMDQGKVAEAMRCYREAVRLKPGFPQAHLNLASALAQSGQAAEAAEHFQRAIQANPRYTRARLGLAGLLLQQDNRPAAREQLSIVLQMEPGNSEARRMMGNSEQ